MDVSAASHSRAAAGCGTSSRRVAAEVAKLVGVLSSAEQERLAGFFGQIVARAGGRGGA